MMQINFEVNGVNIEFSRDPMYGRAVLQTSDGSTIELQSPWKFSTHFNFNFKQKWHSVVAGEKVEVIQQRPKLFAGFRKMSYEVFVNGELVAQARGR